MTKYNILEIINSQSRKLRNNGFKVAQSFPFVGDQVLPAYVKTTQSVYFIHGVLGVNKNRQSIILHADNIWMEMTLKYYLTHIASQPQQFSYIKYDLPFKYKEVTPLNMGRSGYNEITIDEKTDFPSNDFCRFRIIDGELENDSVFFNFRTISRSEMPNELL